MSWNKSFHKVNTWSWIYICEGKKEIQTYPPFEVKQNKSTKTASSFVGLCCFDCNFYKKYKTFGEGEIKIKLSSCCRWIVIIVVVVRFNKNTIVSSRKNKKKAFLQQLHGRWNSATMDKLVVVWMCWILI